MRCYIERLLCIVQRDIDNIVQNNYIVILINRKIYDRRQHDSLLLRNVVFKGIRRGGKEGQLSPLESEIMKILIFSL